MSETPESPVRQIRQRNSVRTKAQAEMVFTCADHNDEDMPRSDYNAAHEWADEMLLTHVQCPCSECGLWRIWIPA